MDSPVLARLLAQNTHWSADVAAEDPEFFVNGAKAQYPKVLWIGCSDSRVPESVLMACKPGEIFTTRNIANQFHLEDDSVKAVLTYAVEHVGVEHVIVCGHTSCGGVATAYQLACDQLTSDDTPIDDPSPSTNGTTTNGKIPPTPSLSKNSPLLTWLTPLTTLALTLGLPPAPPAEALPVLLTASVQRQVENVCKAGVGMGLKPKAEGGVLVHGWAYEMEGGRVRDLGMTRSLI